MRRLIGLMFLLCIATPLHAQLTCPGGQCTPLGYDGTTETIAANLTVTGNTFTLGTSSVVNSSGSLRLNGAWQVASTGNLAALVANTYSITGGATVSVGGASPVTITNANLTMNGSNTISSGTPSCSGAGCALLTGSTNSAGQVSTTTTGAASIVVLFSTAFAHAPACVVVNETTANLAKALSTTTQVTLAGTTVSGDVLNYICLGF